MRNTPLPRRIRTLAATATACALAITTLAACGDDGSDRAGGGGDTLEVWVYQDGATTVQENIVKKFNETSDVKVKLVQVPGDNYQDKMRTAMGSSNAPDVFFNWGGGSISDFVAKDMLVDLTPHLEKDTAFKEAFLPAILNEGKIGDKYYGIPMRGMQPVILFYNKDAFTKAGAEAPKTWDDMYGLVDTFKDDGVTPFVLAGATSWTDLMWMEYLLDRIGGADLFKRIQSGDSNAWGDPAVLKAAEEVKKLVDADAFGKNYKSVDYTNDGASTLFAQGKGAMHLMGSWEYSNHLTNAPEFAEKSLGWLPFPAISDGSGDPSAVVGNPTNYWSIHSQVKGERLDAAIEFLKTAASEEYSKALIENGDIPATTNAEALLDQHTSPEFAKFQYDMVQNASSFTLSWDQALPSKQSTPMMTNIEKLFNGQISPQQFVDAMKAL